MTTEVPNPDPAVVLELLEAFRRSKTMFAAVSLGIFDALEAGPNSVAGLAQSLNLKADALERLLDACGMDGAISFRREARPSRS